MISLRFVFTAVWQDDGVLNAKPERRANEGAVFGIRERQINGG